MSGSVLLLWEPVTWRDAWGAYLERDISGHTIVDGQMFSPFPIELLLSDSPQVTRYGMMETQLSLGRCDALVKAGREATYRYFERLDDRASPAADDPLMSLTSPGAVQYIDDTAHQQLAYVGMINYYIETQGGSYVGGSVITGGGDFTGRDDLGSSDAPPPPKDGSEIP